MVGGRASAIGEATDRSCGSLRILQTDRELPLGAGDFSDAKSASSPMRTTGLRATLVMLQRRR
jgi:hypothetical protein